MIFRLGQRHEKNHLTTFVEVSDLTGKPFAKTLEEIRKGSPVIYQGELRAHMTIGSQVIEIVGIPENESQTVALLPDVDQGLARRLKELGVLTINDLTAKYNETTLSELKRPWGDREQKVGNKAARILLQAKAMLESKEIVLKKPGIPVSKNYVMFDLEGLPPQLDELDKIYLWGMQVFGEEPDGFLYSLAETGINGDRKGWEEFLKIAGKIFAEYGDIPFVHWHHYEKTKIKTYIDRYGDIDRIAERVLSNLVDLLPITRDAVVLPQPSYSLKLSKNM